MISALFVLKKSKLQKQSKKCLSPIHGEVYFINFYAKIVVSYLR